MHHRHQPPGPASPSRSGTPPEVIVKIDRDDGSDAAPDEWRDDASKGGASEFNDPPSKLIGQFLNRQKAAGGEMSLDLDLEMDELRNDRGNNGCGRSPHNPSPLSKEFSLSQEVPSFSRRNRDTQYSSSSSSSDEDDTQLNRRRSSILASNTDANSNNNGGGGNEGTVLRCTSIQRRFSGLGIKTKSRLIDPPEIFDRRSETMKSGVLGRASGILGKQQGDEEEEDPLFDEDLPEEYKKATFDALTVAECISLVLLITAFCCTLAISKLKRIKFRGLSLWKWEIVILALICGRLVSGWVIRIAVFFIERNFFMRKRILYFVYGVRKAVQNCIWLGLVLIAWHSVFDKQLQVNNRFLWYVNKSMVCLVVGTSLWLVKTLMVKVLASSFHVSTFFDRIQETLFNQYVIEALSGPPLIEIRNQQEEEERTMAEVWRLQNAGAVLPPELKATDLRQSKSGALPSVPKSSRLSFKISEQIPKNQQEDQGISIDQLHKFNHKNISAWNMKRLIKIVRKGLLTTLDEKVLDSSETDETSTQIRSEHEAMAAARKIFKNVAKPKAKSITLEDLMRFLRQEEAVKVLNLVEGSTESETISKASLKSWVVNSFVERRALALTLNDTKTAVNKLHQMVNALVGIIILITCLIILRIATGKFLLYISSQIVVVAFVFGNTCKTIFEAIIFVFVIHPFDVGDRCEVDGVQMVVEEMNILTTVFLRYDNLKIIFPNATLATRPICNFYRSPDMGDSIDFSIHIATPTEKFVLIKQRITSYIESRSDYWYPGPTFVVMDLIGLNAIKVSLWLRHRMNHQNIGEKWRRRAILLEEMVRILKELDIEYRLYPVDINIRSMPGATAINNSSSRNLPPPHPNPPSPLA
ncbi:mechanosensitive ion channel protein 6-like [Andrographis paniculata]|uniref:mechanosensitive ion channel protein 6-like n=1 Tax=Andrographis paniculata TaxID=175694 RepID=UPI0021E91E2C|nr:mechanosensitive ion channel protein 6-like [Andrographis paniculata]